jgi:hypothetical protein
MTSLRGLVIAMLCILPLPASSARAQATDGAPVLNLRTSCGAAADGMADDSGALQQCLRRLQASLDAGRPTVMRIPAGIYRITGAHGTMPTLTGRGGALVGDGPHESYFVLDPSYAGDLFSWSEAWSARNIGPPSYDVARDADGASVIGLQVTGATNAPHVQNAFVFYDREDHVLMRDIEVEYLNGRCLSIGRARSVPQSYVRESAFYNIKCFSTGTAVLPAVEISSTTMPGSDATNELDFYKLAVVDARGTGVVIRNPRRASATRRLRFFGLRIEATGADGLAFGDPADDGQVAEIGVHDLTVVNANGAALRFTGATSAPQPYGISIQGGSLGPGNRTGIAIDSGRLLEIDLSSVDAPVILGPGAGSDIRIGGNGSAHDWTFMGRLPAGGEAQPLNLSTPFSLRGLPNGGDRVGAAALMATITGDAPARLTMDGKPPDAYNCFNPGYGQIFNISIQLMARDTTRPDRWFAWTLPLGVLSALSGPRSAMWRPGTPTTLLGQGTDNAHVAMAADTERGCLELSFAPPPGKNARWDVTAHVGFAMAH